MVRLLRATALARALMIPAAEVAGQMNPLRELELSAQGLELLGATASRLYDAGEIGATEACAASGNSGAARLLGTLERDGPPCRRVEHVIKIRQDAVPKRLVLATCRTADGRWLLG